MAGREGEIGALWMKTSTKGVEYMSGEVNGVKIVVFRNDKKTTDAQPDWRILKSTPRDNGGG